MERVNNFLKALIGVLLLISFVITFSSCQKSEHENTDSNTNLDTISNNEGVYSNEPEKDKISSDWDRIKEEIAKEDDELEYKMKEVEKKASKSSKKTKEDVDKSFHKIKTRKTEVKADSLKPEFKEQWNTFKTDAKNTIDSIESKLKK